MTDLVTFTAEIADYLNRDDMTSQIPVFIKDGECRLNRELLVGDRETLADAVVTGGTVALPADFWAMRYIYPDGSFDRPLNQMAPTELLKAYGNSCTGTPRDFSIRGNTILLGPAPADSTTLVMDYYATIPALATAGTNWLLTAHWDLYRAATLAEAYLLLRDTEGATIWENRTQQKIEEVKRSAINKSWAHGLARLRSDVPTLRRIRA